MHHHARRRGPPSSRSPDDWSESHITYGTTRNGWPLVTTVESYEWEGKDARRHIEDYDTPKKAARGCMVAFAVLALLIGGATCALHVAFNRPRSQSLASVISVAKRRPGFDRSSRRSARGSIEAVISTARR